LPYSLRPMRPEDIAQVSEIDREAFPTIWPPTDYSRELKNPLAYCLVTIDDQKTVPTPQVPPAPESGLARVMYLFRELFKGNRPGTEPSLSDSHYIVGFASLWVISDEAHVTNIAVRGPYRRQGIGELMLLSVIDTAREHKANTVTLEARASNTAAQLLYQKYGFKQVGLRRGYYLDNKEDAVLMTTEDINSASFQAQLQQLKHTLSTKLEIT
jgi:ribosomal-protein-alanine N-acetyltransferase